MQALNSKMFAAFAQSAPMTAHSVKRFLSRSFMYIPGDKEKMLNKIVRNELNSDIYVLDCEDGVDWNNKAKARQTISNFCQTHRKTWHSPEFKSSICIRVNARNTDDVVASDLAMFSELIDVFPASSLAIKLPKAESADDVDWLNAEISESARKLDKRIEQPIPVFLGIETARGLIYLKEICERFQTGQQTSSCVPTAFKLKLHGLVCGSDDYCASIGAKRSPSNLEVMYLRHFIVAMAKSFDIIPIDMVDIDLNDLESYRKNCELGAQLGFAGKQVIHPKQLEIVHAAFSPSPADIAWARGVLHAFQEHHRAGVGAFVYRGQMIDMPSIKQAQNIVQHFS